MFYLLAYLGLENVQLLLLGLFRLWWPGTDPRGPLWRAWVQFDVPGQEDEQEGNTELRHLQRNQ